jgi:hypothetical protein
VALVLGVVTAVLLLGYGAFRWVRPVTANDRFADTVKVNPGMSQTARFHSKDETKLVYVGPPNLAVDQIFVAPAMRYREPAVKADPTFLWIGIGDADGPDGESCAAYVLTLRPEKKPLPYMELSRSQTSRVGSGKLAVYKITVVC